MVNYGYIKSQPNDIRNYAYNQPNVIKGKLQVVYLTKRLKLNIKRKHNTYLNILVMIKENSLIPESIISPSVSYSKKTETKTKHFRMNLP